MKRKYFYTIVDKDNAKPLLDCGRLPIFYYRKTAQLVLDEHQSDKKKYIIQPILADGLEMLILKGRRK
jgi:hypothetical protein